MRIDGGTLAGAALMVAGYGLWFVAPPGWAGAAAALAGAGAVVGAGSAVLGGRRAAPIDRAANGTTRPVQGASQPDMVAQAGTATPSRPQPADTGLAETVDHLPLVVLQTDAQGAVRYLSRAWEQLAGRPVAQAMDRPVWSLLHPDDARGARQALQQLLDGDIAQCTQEWRVLDAAGKAVWVALRARALGHHGRVTGLAATLDEVTRRRHLDERLQSQRGYVNALLANVPGLVYRSRNDRSYTMEFISDGCLDLTGYEPYELIENRRLAFGDLIHPEDREFVWTHIQAHLARRDVYQIAYRITDAAGRLRWVWEQGRGVFASQGELLAIEGFITDLSERRGAEEQAKRRLWFEARTGLTSRPIFDQLLDWSLRTAQSGGTPCALLVIELTGLDAHIERHGEEWGERALTVLARRIAQAAIDIGQSAQLAPHCFGLLAHDLRPWGRDASAHEARDLIPPLSRLASALAERLAAPLPGSPAPGPGAAIGIAITAPRYPGSEALLRAARQAAVQAASLGAGHCEFADE